MRFTIVALAATLSSFASAQVDFSGLPTCAVSHPLRYVLLSIRIQEWMVFVLNTTTPRQFAIVINWWPEMP
jgi:hypothetical protein